jgi:hypothetical protein
MNQNKDDIIKRALEINGILDPDIKAKVIRTKVKNYCKLQIKKTIEEKSSLYSDDFLKQIEYIAKNIRRQTFGDTRPPFNSYEDASKWIYEEDLKHNAKKQMPSNQMLIYKIEDGAAICADATSSKELSSLYNDIDWLSKSLGIKQYELLKFILAGEKPEIMKKTVTFLEGIRKRVIIEFNSPDISFDELRVIYEEYRNFFKYKWKKRFTTKQENILNLIKEFREPPEEKVTEYYKTVLKEWNKRYPGDKYQAWQSIYKAYENIKKKLI